MHRTDRNPTFDTYLVASDEETIRLRDEWLVAEQRLDDAMPTTSAWGSMAGVPKRSRRGKRLARRLADARLKSTRYRAAAGASVSTARAEPPHEGWQGRGRRTG